MISKMKLWFGFKGIGALLIIAFVFSGCAEERDPIDRVQPYALDKVHFIGQDFTDTRDDPEFWSRNTVIDVGYGAAQDGLFTSTYAQPMARMKWQITEGLLIGRAAYEAINSSDGKGVPELDKNGTAVGADTQDGIIVCAFAIEKHFDIINAYNPTTGEQLNIREENMTDRPWYERQYMRVDWSQNLNTDSYEFDTLSLVGIYGGVQYEPLSYYVEDPNDEEAPFFSLEDGYFDVTTKAFAKPGTVDLSHLGWGIDTFPACMMPNDLFNGTSPSGNCNPVELTLRHSFRKVVDSDFEPKDYDGQRFTSYGGFYDERHGYARNYRMTDDKWHRFLHQYQIWERSHYYKDKENMTGWIPCNTKETTGYGEDPKRDDNNDGTHDECKAVTEALNGIGGSRCDIFKQRCTQPFQERTAKPLTWYYADGSDPEYFEASELAVHEWDVSLRSAVQTAKYAECKRTGGQDCKKRFPIWTGQMDDNYDAVQLALDVDDCRSGKAYSNEVNGEESVEQRYDRCLGKAKIVGDKRGYSQGVIDTAEMDEMIVLCHSPVQFNDPPACAAPDNRLPPGITGDDCVAEKNKLSDADPDLIDACDAALSVRRGDLRYHVLNAIEEPASPSPWGIYTSSVDPTTGEDIATVCNVWTAVTDFYSQLLVDQLRFIKGELDVNDITEAQYVEDWSKAADAASKGGAFGTLTKRQLNLKFSQLATGIADPNYSETLKSHPIDPKTEQSVENLRKKLSTYKASSDVLSSNDAVYEARRKAARGTDFEAKLITKPVKQLFGAEGMTMSDSVMDMISPLRGGNPNIRRNFELMKQNALHKKGMCILEADFGAQAPIAMTGLADIIEKKFEKTYGKFNSDNGDKARQHERAEAIRKYIAGKMHYAVIAHEIGHSIAHRHNFVSSADSWNYRPQYWQLRTKNGEVTENCRELSADGEDCVGPRYFDPVTENEKNNLIWMFMQTSSMDYPGELTQDFLGPGVYDFAATRMFYGDVVSVHADSSYELLPGGENPRANGVLNKYAMSFGGMTGIQPHYGSQIVHYSELQNHYELIQDCKQISTEKLADFVPARYDESASGSWHPVVDGLIVSADGENYSRCRSQPVDYVTWDSLRSPVTRQDALDDPTKEPEVSQAIISWNMIDSDNRVILPYGFATDRWADLGNSSVYRHDNGADLYEIFNFFVTQKEVQHIFDAYRRQRTDFSVRTAANRALVRFNAKARDGAKGLALYRTIAKAHATEEGSNPERIWQMLLGNPFTPSAFREAYIASTMVFDYFARELQRPQAGLHGKYFEWDPVMRSSELDVMLQHEPIEGYSFVVPNGATGKFGMVNAGGAALQNNIAEGLGDYEPDYTLNSGSYYEKMNVAALFTESVDNFIAQDRGDFYDTRQRSVSLADLFPDGYRRMLANALTNDDAIKGPRIAADANGHPLVSNGALNLPIGWTSWWGETPTHCFPADGTTVCKIPQYYGEGDFAASDNTPANMIPIDPQIGWEQQKFLIAWTMLYLPENQLQHWMDSLRIWEIGRDSDPEIDKRIELHHPESRVFVARSFGKETIFGKSVQKGISARMLEYANDLLQQAYETTPVDYDGDEIVDWYEVTRNSEGNPIVKTDPNVAGLCEDLMSCPCEDNNACMKLRKYLSVITYLRQALDAYNLVDPDAKKGLYD